MTNADENKEFDIEAGKDTVETPEVVTDDADDDQAEDLTVLREQLEAAESRAQHNHEEMMRARAELDNYRKRALREVETARKFALERFMGDLLEVRDSLERGLEAAEADQVSVEQLKEGKALTFRMLDKVLSQHGLTEVEPEGERFDPERHEAISIVPSDEHEPDTVVNVVQKGYLLNDRLLRPARVIVSKPAV